MKHPVRPPLAARRRTLVSLGALGAWGALAGGCGGGDIAGVGSGGTGQLASFSSGTVLGFGSVIVNGVRYDDSAAAVTDDLGRSSTRSALRLGMVVEIDGSTDDAAATGTAAAIRIVSQLRGPIASIDPVARRMVVLGIPVQAGAATIVDGVAGMGSLAAGDVVEVWGFLDRAEGVVRASRIERKAADPTEPYRIRAVVGGLDAVARTFRIGALTVDYAGATLAGLPAAGLADGQLVRVQAGTPPTGNRWRAAWIDGIAASALGSARLARVEGTVNAFASASRFEVDGQAVDAGAATFTSGTASGLANGVRVRVVGTIVGGRVRAATVEVRARDFDDDDDRFEVKGTITALGAAGRFTVQAAVDRLVLVDPAGAVFKDGATAADLKVGARVEVKGRFSGATLLASEVEVDGR